MAKKRVVKRLRARKPHYLLVGTGGTISMVPNQRGVLKVAKDVKQLIKLVPSLKRHATFDAMDLSKLDSSELTPSHWTEFAMAIAKALETGKYDGVLVVHGTDTMAYTATAMALIFGTQLSVPIVFTGSQMELVRFGTDARFNLENALYVLKCAREQKVAEVMIVFNDLILRASRSIKESESALRAFGSPALPPLARITAVGVHFTPDARRVKKEVKFRVRDCNFHFNSGVVVFDLVPGLQPEVLFKTIESGICKALILRSLGAGNVPSTGAYSLIPCVELATKLKIPVIVTTKFVGGTTHAGIYQPGRAALDAGAIESADQTDVCVQAKVAWLLAQGYHSGTIRKALLKPVAGEVTVMK